MDDEVVSMDRLNGKIVSRKSTKNELCDGNHPSRILNTIAIYSTFLIMGFSSPLLGTTYVHLERLLHVDAQTVSMVMVSSNAGYLVGAVVCAILYDRVRPEHLFVILNLVGVGSSIAAAYAQNFVMFVAAMVVHEIAFGFDDAAGQSYCVGLWNDHKIQKPLLQGMHVIWSLGGIFGPMIIKLFLCELDTSDLSNNSSITIPNNGTDSFINSGEVLNQTSNCSVKEESVATTRLAFLTLGVMALVANVPFIVSSFKSLKCKTKKNSQSEKMDISLEKNTTQELLELSESSKEVSKSGVYRKRVGGRVFTIVHTVLIFLFSMLNLYTEFLPILFLLNFAVKHLGWSVMYSSLLMSVYYGAHFVGRVIGVVNSMWLSPAKMICFNLLLTTSAYMLMIFVNEWHPIAWIGAVMAGFGVSTTFPTNVLWISETTPVTGKLGAIMIVGGCCATISAPYLTATLTSTVSQMWYVYILLIASSAHLLVFAVEALLIKRFSREYS